MKVVHPAQERELPRGVVGGAEISQATTGAHNLFMGLVRVPAGARSRPHFHENCESAVYMVRGGIEIRWGDRLEEAAGPVFFLCSPWSNYVHGQTLHITGGMFGGMTGS